MAVSRPWPAAQAPIRRGATVAARLNEKVRPLPTDRWANDVLLTVLGPDDPHEDRDRLRPVAGLLSGAVLVARPHRMPPFTAANASNARHAGGLFYGS
jgi:hypothetical protein